MDNLVALLPSRKNSERIPGKNVIPFGPDGESLLEIKLLQLSATRSVSRIVLSTDDDEAIRQASQLKLSNLEVDYRPAELAQSSTSIADLSIHFGTLVGDCTFLWTHTTSPFLTTADYDQAVRAYLAGLEQGQDSLITVERVRDYFSFGGRPLNFGKPDNYWPRTQDLDPLERITSGIFLGSSDILRTGNRIGKSCISFPCEGLSAIDIDWPDQFSFASALYAREVEREKIAGM